MKQYTGIILVTLLTVATSCRSFSVARCQPCNRQAARQQPVFHRQQSTYQRPQYCAPPKQTNRQGVVYAPQQRPNPQTRQCTPPRPTQQQYSPPIVHIPPPPAPVYIPVNVPAPCVPPTCTVPPATILRPPIAPPVEIPKAISSPPAETKPKECKDIVQGSTPSAPDKVATSNDPTTNTEKELLGKIKAVENDLNWVNGNGNSVLGSKNGIKGDYNQLHGNENLLAGNDNKVQGSGNILEGSGNIVKNKACDSDPAAK